MTTFLKRFILLSSPARVIVLAGVALTASEAQDQKPKTPVLVEISTLKAQMKYDKDTFTVPPNTAVKLTFQNEDDLPHNLVICDREGVSLSLAQSAWELGAEGFEKAWIPDDPRILAASGMVDPQQGEELEFVTPRKEGRYDFVCTYPGHAVLMKGVMVVALGGTQSPVQPPEKPGPIRDLTYTLYKGSWEQLPDFTRLQPESTDSVENGLIDLAGVTSLRDYFGIVFEGLVSATEAGEFTFSLSSDDGSQLFVNDQLVVNHDGIHGASRKQGKIQLTAGEHRLKVVYFERNGEENLEVRWAGPGIKRRDGRLSKRQSRRQQNRPMTGIPLVANERPVIYRNFIEGAGNRAVGVGFPGGVSLAFDADQVRLALMWTDGFMDAARHWNGRGQGQQPPSGKNIVTAPQGEGIALLQSPQSPWPAPAPRASNTRFKGYLFWDKMGNPEFLYRVADAFDVTDRAVGVVTEDGTRKLERQITVHGKAPATETLCMRVASGGIALEKDSQFLSSGGQRIKIRGAEPLLSDQDLIIPIDLASGQTQFSITYEWLAASDASSTFNSN